MTERRGLSFEGMSIGLLFVVVAARALLMEAQSDTFWALRTGQDIWAKGGVPAVDAYSYTAAGLPWPNHEWLWQAALYPLHRAGGMPLVALGAALLVMGAVVIAYRLTVGASGTRFVLLLLGVPLASVVWTLRPQIVTLLFLALLLRSLERERFVALPLLFFVWANAHGGVALGGLLLGVAFVTALARVGFSSPEGRAEDVRRARRLGLVLVACALATAATPMGFGLFRFVFESEARLRSAHINEWQPTLPGWSIAGAFWVVAIVFAALLVLRARSLRAAPWGDWVVVACVSVLLPLAFRSLRHIGPFILLAPAAASRLLGPDFRFRRGVAPSSSPSPERRGLNLALLGVFGAGAAAAVVIAWSLPAPALGWRPLPEGALAAVRACPGPLYNHYNEGGYLIWFAPEKKVFIDNRQDPYPLPFLLEHLRIESEKLPWGPTFRRWGIRCSFLSAESPTVEALAQAGWRDAYRDATWVVQVAP